MPGLSTGKGNDLVMSYAVHNDECCTYDILRDFNTVSTAISQGRFNSPFLTSRFFPLCRWGMGPCV